MSVLYCVIQIRRLMFPFADTPDELPQAAMPGHLFTHSALEHIMPSSAGGGPSL